MKRRQALRVGVGGGITLASAKAIHNVLLGYGQVGPGTNLRSQDLGTLARETFVVPDGYRGTADGREVAVDGDLLWIREPDDAWEAISIPETTIGEAGRIDERLDLPSNPVSELVSDLVSLRADAFEFEFHGVDAFFARLAAETPRPHTTDFLRGRRYRTPEPETVTAFVGVPPTRPRALLEALVDAFRQRTSYDVPRYLAGSVEDNVLFGAVDLRRHFRPEVSFEALLDAAGTGLFCWEFTFLAAGAVHSLPAPEQRAPLLGLWIHDRRHKHVYNGFASVIRSDGELRLPICFVDYTHTTLYDDLSLTWLLGEGFDGYDARHRADAIYWDR